MMTSLQAYLSRWIDCQPDDVASLQPYVKTVTFDRHQGLFRAGDAVDDLILLTEGLVRSYQLRGDREVNLRLLCAPAAVLPCTSYLLGVTSDEDIQCLSRVTGYRLRFRAFCAERPGLLAERLQRLLAERHVIALHRRLCMLQAGSAQQRYRYFLSSMEPDIVRLTPAFHVASYLGITPESLSRLRRASVVRPTTGA